jgi:uncharacterized protein YegP (UPF0339 family)
MVGSQTGFADREGEAMTKGNSNVSVALHRRATPFRKKESYWATISAANGEPLFTSEKYVNRADAIHALELVLDEGMPEVMTVTGE